MSVGLIIGAVGAVAAMIAAVVGAVALIRKWLQDIKEQNRQQLTHQEEQKQRDEEFRTDWYGSPARAGVPAVPGVMARMEKIEHNTESQSDRLDRVEKDLADHIRGPGHATAPVVVMPAPPQ